MGGRGGAGGTIGRSFCSCLRHQPATAIRVFVRKCSPCVGNPACGAGTHKLGLAWHAQQHSARCDCHASGRVKPRMPAATVGGLWPGGQTRFCNLSCAGTLSLSRRRPAIQPCRCTKRQLPAVVARSGPAQRPFDIAEQQRSVFTDQSGEPALNLDIICLEIAGLIVRVFRLQTNAARLF